MMEVKKMSWMVTWKDRRFFQYWVNEAGIIISTEYKEKVPALNKSPLYASLKWLQDMGAIDSNDLKTFEHIKKCRNTLTHEMFKFASEDVDFDI